MKIGCNEIQASLLFDAILGQPPSRPLRAVFRDVGFASDSVKINIERIFKLLSPNTEHKLFRTMIKKNAVAPRTLNFLSGYYEQRS